LAGQGVELQHRPYKHGERLWTPFFSTDMLETFHLRAKCFHAMMKMFNGCDCKPGMTTPWAG
jgi:hypothetical protein